MEHFSFQPDKTTKTEKAMPNEKQSTTLSLVKVYLWFALGLLITGVVSFALPYLFGALAAKDGASVDALANVYVGLLIGSIVLMIPAFIIINVQGFRKNFPVMITSYIIYSLCMGVLLSSLILLFIGSGEGLNTIYLAFFITGGIFLVCGLIGALTKNSNLKIVYPILFSILAGILVISLVNIFIGSNTIYLILDFVLFGVMIISTILDMHNINRIAEKGGFDNGNNLAVYCAFTIYVDFIWLFIRIVYYLLLAKNKN